MNIKGILDMIATLLIAVSQPNVPVEMQQSAINLSLRLLDQVQIEMSTSQITPISPQAISTSTEQEFREVPGVAVPNLESFHIEHCEVARDPSGVWTSQFYPNDFEVEKNEKQAQEALGWIYRECKVEPRQRYK